MTCHIRAQFAFIFAIHHFFRIRDFVANPTIRQNQKNILLLRSYFPYLWLRLRYSRSAKSKNILLLRSYFMYLWLRLRYSCSAKSKKIFCFCALISRIFGCALDTPARQNQNKFCFCARLFVSLHHGSVVQWIEFKIPVLTIWVRIPSESQCTATDTL